MNIEGMNEMKLNELDGYGIVCEKNYVFKKKK